MMSPARVQAADWPDGYDLLSFLAGIVVFLVVGLLLGELLSKALGLSIDPDKTVFQYGGTAVLLWLGLIGSVSFLFGGFVTRRMRRVRARWLSAIVGSVYALVFVILALLIPQGKSLGGQVLIVWLFLFPAIGLPLAAWKLTKRQNEP